jgi:Zn ribbon nucleic-acid-binding protein
LFSLLIGGLIIAASFRAMFIDRWLGLLLLATTICFLRVIFVRKCPRCGTKGSVTAWDENVPIGWDQRRIHVRWHYYCDACGYSSIVRGRVFPDPDRSGH